ncbi:MAG: STAS/SEC14 domain-containing protein [Stellaceae bacterium]
MIEIVEGLPDTVVGLVVKGRLTRNDCTEILLPRLKKAREWHYKLRLYYEIRSRFPGAAWDEIDLGFEHLPQWERVAIVTDLACIRHAIQALRLLIPGEIRAFATSQTPEGLAWITDTPVKKRPLAALPAIPARTGSRSFRPPGQYLHHAS